MNYSFNFDGEDFVRAQSYDVNASYKDLGAVCDAIRYMKAQDAISLLSLLSRQEIPIPYRRHNKHMGSRHELGGSKGGYPRKAASEVMKTLTNAVANASNRGKAGSEMFIVGACANKTHIERRYPSKGSIAWGRGMYGMSATNHSDIEYAKIEIALADEFSDKLTANMKYFIKRKKALQPIRHNANTDKSAQKKPQGAVPQRQNAKKTAQQKQPQAIEKPAEPKQLQQPGADSKEAAQPANKEAHSAAHASVSGPAQEQKEPKQE